MIVDVLRAHSPLCVHPPESLDMRGQKYTLCIVAHLSSLRRICRLDAKSIRHQARIQIGSRQNEPHPNTPNMRRVKFGYCHHVISGVPNPTQQLRILSDSEKTSHIIVPKLEFRHFSTHETV